ncbi:MAG: TRIC cation channel family protein [Christensenellaceae bacterium]|nr:TRIC cation channel family protein [Christensenellaceae bacterium]
MELFVTVLEIIGTVAFAASGAMTAMKKHMDLLGIVVLGIVTAVGGGIIRDLILGITPPLAFRDPCNALIATATAIVMFLPWVRHALVKNLKFFDATLRIMDTLGLGIFTVLGIRTAILHTADHPLFLLIFVGVITGVGGGVLRDVLSGNMPYIFVKHIYACASLVGAVICVLLWDVIPANAAMLIGAVVIIAIRLLSAKFRWNLPRVEEDI